MSSLLIIVCCWILMLGCGWKGVMGCLYGFLMFILSIIVVGFFCGRFRCCCVFVVLWEV